MKSSYLCAALLAATALIVGARVASFAEEAAVEISAVEVTEPGYRQSGSSRDDTVSDERRKLRWREGKRLIDHGGHFRQDGDGAVFVSETGHELVALENLNLERVTRTLKASDESESIRWSVNGVVTEFNGRNYLLIQRAVYKSASPPPIPEQILN
jgi:hypothetical protein